MSRVTNRQLLEIINNKLDLLIEREGSERKLSKAGKRLAAKTAGLKAALEGESKNKKGK